MSPLTHILGLLPLVLAKGEMAGVVFFVIWVIMAIASSLQKKKQQQKRIPQLPPAQDRTLQREPPARAQDRAAQRRSVASPAPARINPAKPSPLPPRKVPAVARPVPPKLPAAAASAVPQPVWQPMKDMVQSQWGRTTTRSSQMQVMLRPATVRQGIVLAEILRPPLALREEESAW